MPSGAPHLMQGGGKGSGPYFFLPIEGERQKLGIAHSSPKERSDLGGVPFNDLHTGRGSKQQPMSSRNMLVGRKRDWGRGGINLVRWDAREPDVES